jgi:hypothetical protein
MMLRLVSSTILLSAKTLEEVSDRSPAVVHWNIIPQKLSPQALDAPSPQ